MLTHGREAFRANDFYSNPGDWELNFVRKPHELSHPVTQGDELEVAGRMFKKYLWLAGEYYHTAGKADEVDEENIYENLGQ